MLKRLIVNDRVFDYQTLWLCSEYGDSPVTQFYHGTETVIKRKWILFGPKIEQIRPKLVFEIYEDSENTRLTKSWWRNVIEKEIELLDRADQLKRGELC